MIYVITGRARSIGNFYDTLINPIKGFLDDNRINYHTIHFADQVIDNEKDLFIGIFHHVNGRYMPKNYIMLAMDPPGNCNEGMKIKLRKAKAILVYTDKDFFSQLNENLIYYPFPYHKSIENMYNIEKNIIEQNKDIITIGCINDKRRYIYDYLKENNYDIYCPNIEDKPSGVYEKEQDLLLYSSKIVLLNNYYKNDLQLPRMTYNASNKIFFIYILNEEDDGNLLEDIYDNLIVKCSSNNLLETVKFYLDNEEKRKENIEKLYNYVSNKLRIEDFLNKDIFSDFQ